MLQNVENSCLWLVFSTFPLCSQMPIVLYHSVIHDSRFISQFKELKLE